MSEVIVLNVRSRIWWLIFTFLLISVFGFMIATFSVDNWVKLNAGDNPKYYFRGNLLKITDGLKNIANPKNPLVNISVNNKPYVKLSCACNFLLETSMPNGTLYPSKSLYKSWKVLFDDLWMAAGIFIVFEISALICIVIIVVTILLFEKKVFYFKFNFCAAGCLWISHIIAIIGWLGTIKLTFDGSCDHLSEGSDGNDEPTICATDGPKLGIFVLIYLSVIMVCYFIVTVMYAKKVAKLKEDGYSEVKTKRVANDNDKEKGDN